MGSKEKFVRAAGFAALLFFVGCAHEVPPPTPDPAAQLGALENRIFVLVQDERHKVDPKAHTLSIDPELVGVARQRSAQMAKANSFTIGTDPHPAATLLMDQDAQFQGLVGENVAAQHYTLAGGIDVDAFAKRFVDTWMASPPHQENLTFEDYSRSGVGAAINGDTVYVTQLFVSDLGLGPTAKGQTLPSIESVESPQKAKDDSRRVPLRGAIVPSRQD